MRRWIIILLGLSLGVCIVGGMLGYVVVLPKLRNVVSGQRDAIAAELANNVAASVDHRIGAIERSNGLVVLRPTDLDVNSAGSVEGADGAGFEWASGSPATIYGFTTWITANGVMIGSGDNRLYDATPSVVDGRIVFHSVTAPGASANPMPSMFLTRDGYAEGMERGINCALARNAVVPTGLALREGTLSIAIKPTLATPTPGC